MARGKLNDSLNQSSERGDCLFDFLVAYAALASRMVHIDHETLNVHSTDPGGLPNLISDRYLNALISFLGIEHPFWQATVDPSRYNIHRTTVAMTSRFVRTPSDGAGCMPQICSKLFELCKTSPQLISKVGAHLNLANRLMQQYSCARSNSAEADQTSFYSSSSLPSELYRLFTVFDENIRILIDKQSSILSIDICTTLVGRLSDLLLQLAREDEQLVHKLLSELRPTVVNLPFDDGAVLVQLGWKFAVLKRCIARGRMEIRIQGVDSMQNELVQVYATRMQARNRTGLIWAPKDHPLARFLCDFIIENKLVEYLVGVESHLQLVSKCGNIIGFLVVAHRYTDADTDVIWNAVTTGQDSRFVTAILLMLSSTFNIAQYPMLLYLTKRLNEIPVRDFDSHMILFGRPLVQHLTRCCNESRGDQEMDLPPFHLCIRLIRDAANEDLVESQQTRDIYSFASTALRELLQFGPSEIDRRTMYQDCMTDISERNDSATGSIIAINSLLSSNPEKELATLCEMFDVAALAVEEYGHLNIMQRYHKSSPPVLHEALHARVQLLQIIITTAPGTISPEVGQRLWDITIGPDALDDGARNTGWWVFIKAIRVSYSRNSFIDQCIREFLPKLQPRFYCEGCLTFIQDSVHYDVRLAATRSDSDSKQNPVVSEVLWQVALRAIPGTIEQKAITMLVNLYLDSPDASNRSKATTDSIHVEVIKRCIRQITSAASRLKAFSDGTSSGEDEPMVIVASDDEVAAERLSFSRSLMILNHFVQGVRSRPKYNPRSDIVSQQRTSALETAGDPIKITYQVFGSALGNDLRTLDVKDLETLGDLQKRMAALTSITRPMLICGGGVIDLSKDSDVTLRAWKLDQKGLLMVKPLTDANATLQFAPALALRPIEDEVMAHFPELYQLLSMEDVLGRQVLDFLITFPAHDTVTSLVCSANTSLGNMFPTAAPLKTLYSIFTLNRFLRQHHSDLLAAARFKRHVINSVTTAICTMPFSISGDGGALDTVVAYELIMCLLSSLEENPPTENIDTALADPPRLVSRLDSLTADALSYCSDAEADKLANVAFAALVKCSLLFDPIWEHLKQSVKFSDLLELLLLDERSLHIRPTVVNTIQKSFKTLNTAHPTSAQGFVPFIWENLLPLIPLCPKYGNAAQKFLEVSLSTFRSLNRASRESLALQPYVYTLSDLLVQHVHHEVVGRGEQDWVVYGLASLLNACLRLARDLDISVRPRDEFLETMFRAHLFPDLASEDQVKVPNLHTKTRHELYSTILILSCERIHYERLLSLVRELLPTAEESQAWTWGIAQPLEDDSFDTNFNFEREKCLRSPTGYPGLRNLSNTCYMNSVFTQLFMNVNFREFLLSTTVADSAGSQRLLHETQNLFGYMQDTMLKAVDSQGIAESLITYDNTLIDVSIQMDADEFFNLLFDRWESQILSSADKNTFRKFYGGQTVQQIKSRECLHISETIEPFSAISLVTLGKHTLEESLNAYVEGEVLEGDNKYSCTSCGSHVAAVKRYCFKELPDSLIFHLKRFDFDVMGSMRNKINDRFEFPMKLDMAPYNVEYLKDPSQPIIADLYELVGVLIHAGTAESGHYYSFIKARPPNSMNGAGWVQFNDETVSDYDAGKIPEDCFGGLRENGTWTRFPKSDNAYMLFYERVKSREESPLVDSLDVPAKCPVPSEFESQIQLNNAVWLRTYCLFDPAHATFSRQLLELLRFVDGDACSDDHTIEKEAIWLSLDYLERVLSRSKDCPNFAEMLGPLQKVIGTCSTCCRLALEWVADHEHVLRNLLLRCPTSSVRTSFSKMIMIALQNLKATEARRYGFQEMKNAPLRQGAIFERICARMQDLWVPLFHLHFRFWDDYFGLLAAMAGLGLHESHQALQHGFLQGCLEILVVPDLRNSDLWHMNPHYQRLVHFLDKGRKVQMSKLVELLSILLCKIDLGSSPVPRVEDRTIIFDGMSLTEREDHFLMYGKNYPRNKKTCIFLERALNIGENPQATASIVQQMILAEDELGMMESVQRTIHGGINIDPAHLAAPWLMSALAFLRSAPNEDNIRKTIQKVASEIDTIGFSGGREHLDFFKEARRISSLRHEMETAFFNRCVLEVVPQWAPSLLMYWEDDVRDDTVELLRTLIFKHDLETMDDEEHSDLIRSVGKQLQLACTRKCNGLVQLQKVIDGRSVEQVTKVIGHCTECYLDRDADQRLIAEAESGKAFPNCTVKLANVVQMSSAAWQL